MNILNICFIYLLICIERDVFASDLDNKSRPDVLFVFIDDLRMPDNEINLPNIQKLAAKGINFQNAFAQQALCAPSRNSILTGRRPDSLRLYDFYSYWRDGIGNFSTIPQLFKEHGYESYSVGKVFHPGISSNFSDDYPYSWSDPAFHASTERYKDAKVCRDFVTHKLQKNLICPVDVEKQPRKTLPDIEILNKALDVLQTKDKARPLFLAVGFHKPHIPLKFPRHYLDDMPIERVIPPKYPSIPENMPPVALHPWSDIRRREDIQRLNLSFPIGIMPPDWTLKIKQAYYSAYLYIDDLIGQLLSNVDNNNTIILLTSDHGWSLGENGLWAKYSNFDVALKVPLIIKAPGLHHKNINIPVELIDIFPTLVELSGINTNIPICQKNSKEIICYEGKSLVPLMRKKTRQAMKTAVALSQYPRPSAWPQANSDKPRLKDIKIMGYSIRTKRYRYTEWISFNNTKFTKDWNTLFGVELYDHNSDPEESNNLYKKQEYTHVRNKLSKSLKNLTDN